MKLIDKRSTPIRHQKKTKPQPAIRLNGENRLPYLQAGNPATVKQMECLNSAARPGPGD